MYCGLNSQLDKLPLDKFVYIIAHSEAPLYFLLLCILARHAFLPCPVSAVKIAIPVQPLSLYAVLLYRMPPGIKIHQAIKAPRSFTIVQEHTHAVHHAFSITSAPTPRFTTSTLFPFSCRSISLASSLLYFRVFTDITLSPLLSLSSSCALIQHFAIRFCAISTPPGTPVAMLPPNHQGFCTREKEWRRSVRGRAALATRWDEA